MNAHFSSPQRLLFLGRIWRVGVISCHIPPTHPPTYPPSLSHTRRHTHRESKMITIMYLLGSFSLLSQDLQFQYRDRDLWDRPLHHRIASVPHEPLQHEMGLCTRGHLIPGAGWHSYCLRRWAPLHMPSLSLYHCGRRHLRHRHLPLPLFLDGCPGVLPR